MPFVIVALLSGLILIITTIMIRRHVLKIERNLGIVNLDNQKLKSKNKKLLAELDSEKKETQNLRANLQRQEAIVRQQEYLIRQKQQASASKTVSKNSFMSWIRDTLGWVTALIDIEAIWRRIFGEE